MAHPPSIAKPSRVSGSLLGLKEEIKSSENFHREGIPLLVSEELLRSRNLGQIDVARFQSSWAGQILEIAEVKSSQTGEDQMQRRQNRRLKQSMQFLASLFGRPARLVLIKPEEN